MTERVALYESGRWWKRPCGYRYKGIPVESLKGNDLWVEFFAYRWFPERQLGRDYLVFLYPLADMGTEADSRELDCIIQGGGLWADHEPLSVLEIAAPDPTAPGDWVLGEADHSILTLAVLPSSLDRNGRTRFAWTDVKRRVEFYLRTDPSPIP